MLAPLRRADTWRARIAPGGHVTLIWWRACVRIPPTPLRRSESSAPRDWVEVLGAALVAANVDAAALPPGAIAALPNALVVQV